MEWVLIIFPFIDETNRESQRSYRSTLVNDTCLFDFCRIMQDGACKTYLDYTIDQHYLWQLFSHIGAVIDWVSLAMSCDHRVIYNVVWLLPSTSSKETLSYFR